MLIDTQTFTYTLSLKHTITHTRIFSHAHTFPSTSTTWQTHTNTVKHTLAQTLSLSPFLSLSIYFNLYISLCLFLSSSCTFILFTTLYFQYFCFIFINSFLVLFHSEGILHEHVYKSRNVDHIQEHFLQQILCWKRENLKWTKKVS